MSFDIEISKVNVQYSSTKALDHIDLRLQYGKIYGLLGRNGAGKTTLLSILGSFMEPTSGTVRLGGRQIFEQREVMQHIIFVYDADYKEETEKVQDMLEAVEHYRPHFDREYADYLAKRFKLPLQKKMKELSKGQQSAVNITIGLASRSPVTIFDEAYLGMDAPSRDIFYRELLEDHAQHPRTIILSTHHVSEVEHLFEEVIMLHEGRLLIHAPIDQLLERGAAVTGAAQDVDSFVKEMKVLHTEQLGGTKQAMVFGNLGEAQRQAAKQAGLELGIVSLQQLFIHMTEEENVNEVR